jgi:hypothetical protein
LHPNSAIITVKQARLLHLRITFLPRERGRSWARSARLPGGGGHDFHGVVGLAGLLQVDARDEHAAGRRAGLGGE